MKANGIDHREILKTQQEMELLRDHYGPNWLQAIGDKFQDSTQSDASNSDADSGIHFSSKKTENILTNENGVVIKKTNQIEPSEDDLYLKDTVTHGNLSETGSVGGNDTLKSALNGTDKSDVTVTKHPTTPRRLDSASGIDWTETKVEEDNINLYGMVFKYFAYVINVYSKMGRKGRKCFI